MANRSCIQESALGIASPFTSKAARAGWILIKEFIVLDCRFSLTVSCWSLHWIPLPWRWEMTDVALRRESLLGLMILVILSVFFTPPHVFPAEGAPRILNYQGTLTDDQGVPVQGTKTMSFRIYATIGDVAECSLAVGKCGGSSGQRPLQCESGRQSSTNIS